ncbi:hypothetical protein RYX36_033835 [Vicia faba]
MGISEIAKKLGLSDSKLLIQKAAELRRLCDVHFDSSIIGIGEVAKAIICMEIAAMRLSVLFDQSSAVKLSGMLKLDVRELAIRFGCVRIIPYVRDYLKFYKDRFLDSLPAARRVSADFTRLVFMAVAFYLSAKKQKLKVDKIKLIELCGTSESEFSSVISTSMKDLCHDVFGIAKEKKDPTKLKTNRDLLDVLPSKRKAKDGGYPSDDGVEI